VKQWVVHAAPPDASLSVAATAIFHHVPLRVSQGESNVMYDLLIKNGLVANEYTVLPLDVAVQEEKVVALASHGALDAIGAQHILDAQGKLSCRGALTPTCTTTSRSLRR
jgi:hypothetical protein